MKHIKELLHFLTTQQDNQSWKQYIIQHWHTIIGDLNDHVVLEKIQGATLVLGVHDSCWLHELHLLSPIIIQKINAKLDKPEVKELRFKYSAQKPRCHKKVNYTKNNMDVQKYQDEVLPLTPKQQSALKKIQDNDLQQALYRFLVRCTRK